ncbi:MAG: hypothetical protein L0Y45_02725, partial [Woeseiaceae bacterium]|nr:hypothetical protein [Woeseiaceae bacterium]
MRNAGSFLEGIYLACLRLDQLQEHWLFGLRGSVGNWMEMGGQMDGPVPFSKWMELEVEMDSAIRTETITITPAILTMIAEIDEFKGAW